MSRLHQAAIKDIAKELAYGNTCYVDIYTKEIFTIDHSTEDEEIIANQGLALVTIEKKRDNYLKIGKLEAKDRLEIMEYFLEEIPDKSLRKQLSNGLKRKNPIRNFNQAVESDMELQQQWNIFSREEYQRWVSNFIIDAYNF